jgi:hypothetical protein
MAHMAVRLQPLLLCHMRSEYRISTDEAAGVAVSASQDFERRERPLLFLRDVLRCFELLFFESFVCPDSRRSLLTVRAAISSARPD